MIAKTLARKSARSLVETAKVRLKFFASLAFRPNFIPFQRALFKAFAQILAELWLFRQTLFHSIGHYSGSELQRIINTVKLASGFTETNPKPRADLPLA